MLDIILKINQPLRQDKKDIDGEKVLLQSYPSICGHGGRRIRERSGQHLFKASTSSAMMSYYVFITYSYAIATLVLLPLPLIFYSRAVVSPLKLHLFSRICLLGLIGFLAQACSYKGIEYSSPTLASAVGNLSPAFTFILAVIFRMEKIQVGSITSQAKIIGTIVSISGALVVVLYKGPKVFSSSSLSHQRPLESSEPNWLFGGVLIAVAYLLYSFWYIIQTRVMQIYKQELTIAFLYNLCATVIAMPISLIVESNMSSWRPTPALVIVTVLYSGVFSSISSSVHIWGLHLKGPVYVVIFKPLSIAIAAFMSAIFLGDTLHLGSVIGAIILSSGFYAVIWGKVKEENRTYDHSGLGATSRSSRTPLSYLGEIEILHQITSPANLLYRALGHLRPMKTLGYDTLGKPRGAASARCHIQPLQTLDDATPMFLRRFPKPSPPP
ncbi:WAT1-related protein [Hibiscus syriacus]|uniref:WAT1-related protein n=1 Tax=Hibiscus syriacus TaxID=106335 RepID=A0A6A3BMN8_HIBSY|nr:WAT1-related protein [Hibiscus syriacus]